MGRVSIIGALMGTWLWATVAWATTYTIDPEHTAISFKVRHLFAKVQGTFDRFAGEFVYVPGEPEAWTVTATIETASLNTRLAPRDHHLRSKDFFDVERYPTMTFRSTAVREVTPTSATLEGLLSIHGVERPVVLDLTIHGVGEDPWGNLRSGFTATTTINRTDFGMTWNKVVETGQLLVGEEAVITLEVEGIVKE